MNIDDVAKVALALPGVEEGERHGHRAWFVNRKSFLWERPFSKADIKRFGPDAVIPQQPIIAFVTEDLHEKEAILAEGMPGFFTIEHFNGYAALLIELGKAKKTDVKNAINDAWLVHAPAELAEAYLAKGKKKAPPQ